MCRLLAVPDIIPKSYVRNYIFATDMQLPAGELIRRIDRIAAFLAQEEMKNHIEFV